MRKHFSKKLKAFNMVELMIVVCLMLTTVILCLPVVFNNTKEAKIISNWKKSYTEMESNFEVFNVSDKEDVEAVCKMKNPDEKSSEIFKIFSPYLNVDLNQNPKTLKSYNYKFKNGAQIPMKSQFFTKNFSYQDSGNIVAFKWLTCDCTEEDACAVVLFDMNGTKKPNRIGKDIFVINIFKNRIEPFGASLSNRELSQECSNPNTNGVNCSEYYLRGGRF